MAQAWSGFQCWVIVQQLFHCVPAAPVSVSCVLLGLFVSCQEDGLCQSKSFLTHQCLPFSDFCQQNGLGYSVRSPRLYYVQLTAKELPFSLLKGLVLPFLLLLCAVLGIEDWGIKVNCFWAKCVFTDVTFKIMSRLMAYLEKFALVWCSSNELLFHCFTEYLRFHVFLLNLLKKKRLGWWINKNIEILWKVSNWSILNFHPSPAAVLLT